MTWPQGTLRSASLPLLSFFLLVHDAVPQGSRADKSTLALWLFDEPQYLHMALTDASSNQYDLRLLEAGKMVEGRFGRAVGRKAEAEGQAICFAGERRHYANDWAGPLKSRWATTPEKLLNALSRESWTWETWIRFETLPPGSGCLLDLGEWDLRIDVLDRGECFDLRSKPQGIHARIAPQSPIQDGNWHHLAISWERDARSVICFVDGQREKTIRSVPVTETTWPEHPVLTPGLYGFLFASGNLTREVGDEISETIDFDKGKARGTDWSERWKGAVTGPITGKVTFRAEANAGIRLWIDGEPVIDGWGPEKPRSGTHTMDEGKRHPVVLEYFNRGDAVCRLYWKWEGHREEIVPGAYLSHLPEDRGASPDQRRFDLSLLGNQEGLLPCPALLDEMRICSGAIDPQNFSPPETLSRRKAPSAARPASPTGLPLLFLDTPATESIPLGKRKHLFVDDVLIEESQGVTMQASAPLQVEELHWEQGLGDASVVDHEGKIFLYYGGWTDPIRLATSKDGLHFKKPELDILSWGGQTEGMGGNAVFRLPGQACVFKDLHPLCPPSQVFKATAFIMTRGIYALTSGDGVHWRRNETIMLPFDCGGGVESFWDDQRDTYVCHIRHEGHYAREGKSRRISARAETHDFLSPWPFEPDPSPIPRKAFTLPALWDELPRAFVPDESGQVYRCRAIKYPWAPDVYLAFVWRYDTQKEIRQTELATSRDNRNWTFFGIHPAYLPEGLKFGEGFRAKGALAAHGLVRRGEEVWQYAELCTAGHGGPSRQDAVRVSQRLDGFAALTAGEKRGWAITYPLVFEGASLQLNVFSQGEVRIALLNAEGRPLPGHDAKECDPIVGDSRNAWVSWSGKRDVSPLEGKPVRLRFEMRAARLYGFQFVE